MPLDNFGSVAVHIYRSGQPDAVGFDTLKDVGVSTILKLNSESLVEETTWCAERDIALIQKPMGTFINSVAAVLEIADLLDKKFGMVLVHCQHGRDRTGLIVGAYRIKYQGWTVEQADAERKAYGVEGIIKVADFDMEIVLAEIYKRCHP